MSNVGTFWVKGTGVKTVKLDKKGLRFKCRRCATFCCRLGGPMVGCKDLRRLKKAISKIDSFIETAAVGTSVIKVLASKPNRQCILLRRDSRGKYRCSEYALRPDACRTYPFKLIRRDSCLTVLVSPCRGLNYKEGQLIDERLVGKYLRFATVA